jgi:hypothetical protein
MNFSNEPECLLDWAVKACQGQTLQLFTNINKFWKKSFITLAPDVKVIKLFSAVIYDLARVFVPGMLFHLSLMFVGKSRSQH